MQKAVIPHTAFPELVNSKHLFLRAATFDHEGRKVSICAERMEDIEAVWGLLDLELDLGLLDKGRVISIVVMRATEPRTTLKSGSR